jgi:myo-inositol 2-dehydrogenase / D-chiro-inositol 1-dehydrogenase
MKRRVFLKNALTASAGAAVVPTIIPSYVIGKNPPSDKINIGQIGCGRIGLSLDLPAILKFDVARVVACCDFDSNRVKAGKEYIENGYAKQTGKSNYVDVKTFEDYRDMLVKSGIDAVIISTPDHWHAQPVIEAALAGKDIMLQKPFSLTIAEGRLMADIVRKKGRILQVCTQHRTSQQFRIAAELVQNGRIGKLQTVRIGFPGDPSGPAAPEMPVPKNFNYDMWLGSTPEVYYTEIRVHPQKDFSRPGWLRCHQFGAGAITGTGQHYLDLAAWGMNTERTGPVSIEAVAEFPKSGLWDCHGDFMVKMEYANGVTCIVNSNYPVVVRYEGTDGWVAAGPGNYRATSSDPVAIQKNAKLLDASDPKILTSVIKENEIHLYKADNQHGNWLECIKSRKDPISPAEIGHRSGSVCLLSDIAMKLARKLYWDPEKEKFRNDNEANSMLARPQRKPYGTNYLKLT